MPLEPIFGWTKHQTLGRRPLENVSQLRAAVGRCFHRPFEQAKERRNRAWILALPWLAQRSVSVLRQCTWPLLVTLDVTETNSR